jgi:hypothetical protein
MSRGGGDVDERRLLYTLRECHDAVNVAWLGEGVTPGVT